MCEEEKKIAYLCDGLDPKCSEKIGCYRCLDPNMRLCCHTFKEENAMFGVCQDPGNHPNRFQKLDNSISISYWEIEPERNFWESGTM